MALKGSRNVQGARGKGIAQAEGGGTATVNIGYTAEELQGILRAAGAPQQAAIDHLSVQLQTAQEAVRGFFRILNESEVPPELLPQKLAEIAQRHRELLERLSVLEMESPETKSVLEKARAVLAQASTSKDYERADRLLQQAEEIELRAAEDAEKFAQEAQESAQRRRRSAAATRAERAALSMTRLDYLEAAGHFKSAAEAVGQDEFKLWMGYRVQSADAMQQHGDEKGDNQALVQAIASYRETVS